jgi:dCTP deaminase
MLLSDKTIKSIKGIVEPLHKELTRFKFGRKKISYGLSSFGYDLTAASKDFLVFQPSWLSRFLGIPVDPKNFNKKHFKPLRIYRDSGLGDHWVELPAKSFALLHVNETVTLPSDVTALVTCKSTYARSGLIVLTTVGEAGWQGQYVIELYNTLSLPLRVYIDEGIAQILFMRGDSSAEVSYADRDGKYQGQTGTQLPL